VRVVLLGPPGVGKGTQGRRLAGDRGWPLISTGELLRDAVARRTPLGLEAQQVMDAGRLVSDGVMIGLVRERTAEPDANGGFVLDGFPRTVPQAEALDALLAERGRSVDVALALIAPESELVQRLSARRECPTCKRAYNMVSAPPRDDLRCDDHPEVTLIQRADDAEPTIRKRLEVYGAETRPLVDYYRTRGRLAEVSGTGATDDVYDRLRTALGAAVGGR
jgi:adenylate kinase